MFPLVSRIKAQSHTYNAEIEVDINTEIYPIGSSDTVVWMLVIFIVCGDDELDIM